MKLDRIKKGKREGLIFEFTPTVPLSIGKTLALPAFDARVDVPLSNIGAKLKDTRQFLSVLCGSAELEVDDSVEVAIGHSQEEIEAVEDYSDTPGWGAFA